MIAKFDGKWRWLSNFWPSNFVRPTVEHRYQAAKTEDMLWFSKIVNAPTPGEAKRLGRRCPVRPDWDQIKDEVMYNLVKEKFAEPALQDLLLATGDTILQEGNSWGDTYWGVDFKTNQGQNRLGKILMRVRSEYVAV